MKVRASSKAKAGALSKKGWGCPFHLIESDDCCLERCQQSEFARWMIVGSTSLGPALEVFCCRQAHWYELSVPYSNRDAPPQGASSATPRVTGASGRITEREPVSLPGEYDRSPSRSGVPEPEPPYVRLDVLLRATPAERRIHSQC